MTSEFDKSVEEPILARYEEILSDKRISEKEDNTSKIDKLDKQN